MRHPTSASRLPAIPQPSEHTVNPETAANSRLRQPTRCASQPVIGVPTATATRLAVTTQAISSCVADSVPLIWGSTTLASVIAMPNSSVESWIATSTSHWRGLMLEMRPSPAAAADAVMEGLRSDHVRWVREPHLSNHTASKRQ